MNPTLASHVRELHELDVASHRRHAEALEGLLEPFGGDLDAWLAHVRQKALEPHGQAIEHVHDLATLEAIVALAKVGALTVRMRVTYERLLEAEPEVGDK